MLQKKYDYYVNNVLNGKSSAVGIDMNVLTEYSLSFDDAIAEVWKLLNNLYTVFKQSPEYRAFVETKFKS